VPDFDQSDWRDRTTWRGPLPSPAAIWRLLNSENLPADFRESVQLGLTISTLLRAALAQSLEEEGHSTNQIATLLSAKTAIRHREETIASLLTVKPEPALWKIRFANLVSGRFTELVFAEAYSGPIQAAGLQLIEETAHRSFLDFRVVEPPPGPFALSLNVKNAGTQMRQARDFFGLEPDDTLPIATYKAFGAEQASIPPLMYVFLVDWTLIQRLRAAYWKGLSDNEKQVFRFLTCTKDIPRRLEDGFISGTVDLALDQLLSNVGYQDLAALPFYAISAGKCHRIFYENHQRTPYVYLRRMDTDPAVHVSVQEETIRFSEFIEKYLSTPKKRNKLLQGLAQTTSLEVPDPPV
jgi:hypothetical protein